MHSESLPERIDRFVSYKRANGYQYQTGTYYLKKYAGFVMETAPQTTAPDKVSVEGLIPVSVSARMISAITLYMPT